MDFPTDVDCLVCGTGLTESIISASLSVLGKRVLQIDENDYYGGRLASLRFEDFVNTISSVSDRSRTPSEAADSVGIVNIRKPFGCGISYGEAHWCLNEKFNGFTDSSTSLPVGPSTTVVLDENVDETILTSSGTSSAIPNRVEDMDNVPDDQTTLTSAPDANASSSVNSAWNRASLEQKLRRIDLDLLPKIIYAESPTVTALLRADVTRYLEFRFVSRLLAMTVPPSSGTEYPPSAPGSNLEAVVDSGSSELQEHAVEPTRIVQIPVCRSEVFKTRLLTLRQKRTLGSFFEWCFHLPLNAASSCTTASPDIEVYKTYAERPLRDLLTESRDLDSFTQYLVINNLALGSDEITTKEAVQRIRQLLLSMNRFGPYPLLWPMYGCGDLPQGYCRMSAVFGAVFCLGCCLTSIRRYETQSGDNKVSTDTANSTNQPPNFIARLSNGHEVRTQCILIGAEQAPIDWIQSQVHRWCARAVFLTDRSLLVEGRKSTDITMLALPLSGRGENGLDPAILLEIPVEPSRVTDPELFIVHLTATVREAMDAEKLFRPVIRRLFHPQNQDDENELSSPHPVESRPKLLWTSYFCLPDLSTVELTVPLAATSDRSRFTNSDGLYVVPGPDLSVHLDSTVITAETIFRAVITQLGIQSNEQQSAATGGSDGPPISTLTSENGNAPPETSESTPYVSLDARWDGLFPPRPPRPEDIVVPTDNEGGQLMDL